MRSKLLNILIICFTLCIIGSVKAIEFPERENPKYKGVPYIEIEQLYEDYQNNNVIIIDVRSELEYKTIHINKAVFIPIGNASFINKLKKIAGKNTGKKIVFYCNGITCLKSYEAQLKSQKAEIKNTYAFDLGIPGWAEKYPSETILLGKQMDKSGLKWISKEEFKGKCLSWEDFKASAGKEETIIIDARDNIQKWILSEKEQNDLNEKDKNAYSNFINKNNKMLSELGRNNKVIAQPMDRFIKNIKLGTFKKNTILIFDQVGKQVRWLMYQLENEGYSNYFFLDKGANCVIKTQSYK